MTIDGAHPDAPLTDEELRTRTNSLVLLAEEISMELRRQTERLAAAIAEFEQDVLEPRRLKEQARE